MLKNALKLVTSLVLIFAICGCSLLQHSINDTKEVYKDTKANIEKAAETAKDIKENVEKISEKAEETLKDIETASKEIKEAKQALDEITE
jgi:peptidoglycan hydrolase CwlO-like protein